MHFRGRVCIAAGIVAAEYAGISLTPHPWCSITRFVSAAIVFLFVLGFLGARRLRANETLPAVDRRMFAAHAGAMAVFCAAYFLLTFTKYGGPAVVAVWFVAIGVGWITVVLALVPARVLAEKGRHLGWAWAYAAGAALVALALRAPLENFWGVAGKGGNTLLQRTTLRAVQHVLEVFYSGVRVDPATFMVGLPHFEGTIAGYCSGIEGLALTLVFSTGSLWYTRRELRFPRALLLVPCALALIWSLNIARIAALLAVGNAGHENVALGGFHSEAGWIAFNAVALGFLTAAGRVQWLRAGGARNDAAERNGTAVYLAPFLALLAAASISRAVSGEFEWMYPIRLAAVAAVLWWYRAEYRRTAWKFGWAGPAAGVAVFAMWLGLERWSPGHSGGIDAGSRLGAALAAMSPGARWGWVALRALGAVVTVPIAEELAFRGFLMRRLTGRQFEAVAYGSVTVLAVLLSSAAFGAMHGRRWVAGTVAGIVYALAARRAGRLGEAVTAHATTNLLLAVWVITRGEWGLW